MGHSAAGRIRSIEKSNYLIGNRTRDLPACSPLPQPSTLPHAHAPWSLLSVMFKYSNVSRRNATVQSV
jgi:hypothetical protein